MHIKVIYSKKERRKCISIWGNILSLVLNTSKGPSRITERFHLLRSKFQRKITRLMGSEIFLQRRQTGHRSLHADLKHSYINNEHRQIILRLVRIPFTEIYSICVSRIGVSGDHRQLSDSSGSVRPVLEAIWERESNPNRGFPPEPPTTAQFQLGSLAQALESLHQIPHF